ncbi:hypothetical protein A4X09_0g4450 [Tilletia walkeri]|uniref:Peptidase S8/S53 domain-containing protein n=2 Tax=Tilletia TaxID=13289 RepID=A0A8X7N7T1_9BASI|nr:hypothetical protein A4X09_0g4450 [Tilletia walkeri]
MVKASWSALRLLAILPVFLNCATVTVASLKFKSHTGLNAQKDSTAQKYVPGGYVVLFKNEAASTSLKANDRTESVDDTVHTAFEQFLSQKSVPYTTRIKFTSTNIISAMSLQLHNEDDLSVLHSFDGTADVFKIGVSSINSVKPVRGAMHDRSASHERRSSNSGNAIAAVQDTFTPHIMTGIDKVHADGNLGQGIVIGLLDDGVDYTHHALNGGLKDGVPCLGHSCPISGGMSFSEANNKVSTSSDPFPHCNDEGEWGHGTHTAGTIIADDKIRGFTGGSPRAQLKAYRVLDCEGNAPDDIVAAAMQRASFDGVDLISMSLGRSSGWRESFLDIVSKRITDAGMPIVTSSGNDGGAGAFCTYAPAGGEGVHTVGSVGNLHIPGFTATVKTKSSSFTFVYAAANPVSLNGSQSLPVFLNSLTGVDDTCAPLKKGISLEHSIPVIAIGDGCYTKDQANNVIAANANIALWYIDSSSPLLTVYVDIGIPGFQPLITDEKSGKRIVEAVKAEGDVTIDFSNPEASYIEDNVEGGFTAFYSS